MTATASFRAMGTEIAITGVGVPDHAVHSAVGEAAAHADAWEQVFSRFRPDSILCRLNAAGGEPLPAPAIFRGVLARARDAVRATGGLFNPAVLPALEALGYDRSFERLPADTGTPGFPAPALATWDTVEIGDATGTARLPRGMRIDLGGIAKGAWVDAFAAHLRMWPGGCVNAGGDLIAWGEPPDGDAWLVGLEDPAEPARDALVLELAAGARQAVATSGPGRRHWQRGGAPRHHLVDPRTGVSGRSPLASVTVVGADVAGADVIATAAFVASGRGEWPDLPWFRLIVTIDHAGGVTMQERSVTDVPAFVVA